MSLEKQMKTGQVYVEFGHSDPEDIAYEKVTEDQRLLAKDLCYDYNNTRPTDLKSREAILAKLLGSAGEGFGWSRRSTLPTAATPTWAITFTRTST